MKERVRITDVSPRDGLQNEPGIIPTADKVRLIELLCATGVDEIEVTSFVSPKWVPQLRDAAEVVVSLEDVLHRLHGTNLPSFNALIPNVRGWEGLRSTYATIATTRYQRDPISASDPIRFNVVDKISIFTAASETFSQRNTNATIAETIERFQPLMNAVSTTAIQVRGYISCVVACPFEGPIHPSRVADLCARLIELGVHEIDLGDTIGAATPETTASLLESVEKRIGPGWFERRALTLHLHDTFGRAAECVHAALDLGVRSFDGSVAGLGGCPYASKTLPDGSIQRAPGNISTELLVQTIEQAGYETGVDLDKLAIAADFARDIVRKSRSASQGEQP